MIMVFHVRTVTDLQHADLSAWEDPLQQASAELGVIHDQGEHDVVIKGILNGSGAFLHMHGELLSVRWINSLSAIICN